MSKHNKPSALGTHAGFGLFRKGAGSKVRYWAVNPDTQEQTREFASQDALKAHLDETTGQAETPAPEVVADEPTITERAAEAAEFVAEQVALEPESQDVAERAAQMTEFIAEQVALEPEAQAESDDVPVEDEPIADVAAQAETPAPETVEVEPQAETPAPHIHAFHLKYTAQDAEGTPFHIPCLNCFGMDAAKAYTTPAGGPNAIVNSRDGEFYLWVQQPDASYDWQAVTPAVYGFVSKLGYEAWVAEKKLFDISRAPLPEPKAAKAAAKQAAGAPKPAVTTRAPRTTVASVCSWKAGDKIDGEMPFGFPKSPLLRWMHSNGFSKAAAIKFFADHNGLIQKSQLDYYMGGPGMSRYIPNLSADAATYMEPYKAVTEVAKAVRVAAANGSAATPAAPAPAVATTAF